MIKKAMKAVIVTIVHDRLEETGEAGDGVSMHAVTVPGYTEVLCGREGEVQRRFYNDAKNAIKHPKLGERGVVVEEELFDGKTWFFYREGEHEQNV